MTIATVKLRPDARSALIGGSFFLFLGVLLGAFGAHALQKYVDSQTLQIWETGVRYQIFHGLALLALASIAQVTELPIKVGRRLIVVGTILFSFDCYCYTVTGIKPFAMLIPVGGTLLLGAWLWFLGLVIVRTRSA